MGQLCSCHSGKANQRKDFSSSWSNLLSKRSGWSSWRRRRLKSVEFLGHDNLPFDPVPNKAFQLIDRCEKHLLYVSRRTRSAPERNGINEAETDEVSDAEQSEVSGRERNVAGHAERSGVADPKLRGVSDVERVLRRESMWKNSDLEMRRRRVMLQWQRANGGAKSLNLPNPEPVQTVQPPLARFLRKKRANLQPTIAGGSDPWNCGRLIEDTREWLCSQLDPWMLFQSLQALHRQIDGGLLALELGRCTTRADSCRCLLDYATAVPTENDDGQPPNFRLIREVLEASKDKRLIRIAEFLEVVDSIVDLSRSIGRSLSGTSDNPEESISGERPTGSDPPPDVVRRNKDAYFRCEIVHPSETIPCLYTTCVSVDRGDSSTVLSSTPLHRDPSFTRRRHSALCHSDDIPRNLWTPPSSFQPEAVPSLSLSICSIDLDEEQVQELTRILVDYQLVTDVSIVRTGLGDDGKGFIDMCKAFDRPASQGGIEHFDFRMNPLLPGDHVGHLSGALRSATALRSINLSSTGLSAEACRCLLEAIGTGSAANRVLAELDLGYNELSDEGCASVAALIEMPGCWLRKLRLRHNGIGPAGARRLASALLTHPRLTLLDVSSNPVGDGGVSALAGSLLGNRTLRDVALDDCGISEDGCREVARMLTSNSTLRSLTLSRNSLGDDGVRTLGEGVRYNRTLEVLGIDMCCLGNAGFVSLLQELRWCHSLRVVRACYNSIGIPDHISSVNRRWSSASVRLDASTLGPAPGSEPQLLDIYVQLCEVLRQNPKLKIFLWGNRLDDDDDDVTSASAFRPEVGDPGAKWRRSRSALDSGYGTLS